MLRRAIAIFLMLWLSLQGGIAVAMPFCQHEHARPHDMARTVDAPAHCHEQQSEDSGKVSLQSLTEKCDGCDYCLWFSFAALPKVFSLDSLPPAFAPLVASPMQVHEAFTGLPYRPPIA